MKKRLFIITLWIIGLIAAGVSQAGSIFQDRAGIGMRGSYWATQDENTMVRISSHGISRTEVSVGGAGGWLSFYSGAGRRLGIEFTLGGIGRAEVNEKDFIHNDVRVSGVMPILIGIQYALFSDRGISAFQPYLSAGGGPYILSKVQVRDDLFLENEISVKNKVRPGVYGALGGYFLLSNWFGLQGEMRYHLVNINPDDPTSGFEMEFGIVFFWKR